MSAQPETTPTAAAPAPAPAAAASTSASAPIVSHGRGGMPPPPPLSPLPFNKGYLTDAIQLVWTGQGNIGADPTPYVDGEIVRSGPVGDQGDGAYSAGVRFFPLLQEWKKIKIKNEK